MSKNHLLEIPMNLETLAQDVFDENQAVKDKEKALFLAKAALLNAKANLNEALGDTNELMYKQVAINLKDHVLICEWDGDSEYTMNFVWKAPNANS